jgi:hypothetical protein
LRKYFKLSRCKNEYQEVKQMALNNIGNMMKIMNAWNIFKRNHPKFPAFCNAVSKRALKEGSIMAITVTTPDGEKIETNLRIKAEDLELLKELAN